jgi:hypothetical protein
MECLNSVANRRSSSSISLQISLQALYALRSSGRVYVAQLQLGCASMVRQGPLDSRMVSSRGLCNYLHATSQRGERWKRTRRLVYFVLVVDTCLTDMMLHLPLWYPVSTHFSLCTPSMVARPVDWAGSGSSCFLPLVLAAGECLLAVVAGT